MRYTSFEHQGVARVISLLKSQTGRHFGIGEISDILGIGRDAVRGHINEIRGLGYSLESENGYRYRLTGITGLPLPWEITENIKTELLGRRVYFFDSIESTQGYAVDLAAGGGKLGSVVIAREQTGGRGRLGRKWASPPGGVWMSVVLRPDLDADVVTLLPAAASVALSVAMDDVLGIKTGIKWPNDILVEGGKAAGIIIDADIESDKIRSLVLGAGINLNVSAGLIEDMIGEAKGSRRAASVPGMSADAPVRLIQKFLAELEAAVRMLQGGRTGQVVLAWTERSCTIGEVVSAGRHRGTAVRLDPDGALVIRYGTGTKRIVADDIL